jgi:hypothetical protein
VVQIDGQISALGLRGGADKYPTVPVFKVSKLIVSGRNLRAKRAIDSAMQQIRFDLFLRPGMLIERNAL